MRRVVISEFDVPEQKPSSPRRLGAGGSNLLDEKKSYRKIDRN